MAKKFIVGIYAAVWLFTMVVFWCFAGAADAMAFSLIFLWFLLPATAFGVSVAAGVLDPWPGREGFVPLILGIFQMLAGYLTFMLANTLAFGRVNLPDLSSFFFGFLLSAIGLGVGSLIRKKRR